MSFDQPSTAEEFAISGNYQNMGEYQQLKVAHDMEVDAVKAYYNKLRNEGYSDEHAVAYMRNKGYNISLLKK